MIRQIIQSKVFEDQGINQGTYICLDSGVILVGFEVSLVDMEVKEDSLMQLEEGLIHFIRSMDSEIQIRFIYDSKMSYYSEGHSRSSVLETIGFMENRIYLFFETTISYFKDGFNLIRNFFDKDIEFDRKISDFKSKVHLEFLKEQGCIVRPLRNDEYFSFGIFKCHDRTETRYGKIVARDAYIDFGSEARGVVKLVKQSTHSISMNMLAYLKDELPAPFRYVILLKNVASYKSESELRKKSNQQGSGNDKIALQKYVQAQDDLAKVAMLGARLIEVEVQIVLSRRHPEHVRGVSEQVIETLRPLGTFYIENYGVDRAYQASLIGEPAHVPFLELDEVIPSYVPLLTKGLSHNVLVKRNFARLDHSERFYLENENYFKMNPDLPIFSDRRLFLHRLDDSLDTFDVFDPSYDSYSTCIFGLPGSGKSVLTNMLTRALIQDPFIQIVKLDVGGSHSRETQLLGGSEIEFTMDRPTGFNPMSFLKDRGESPELIQILAAFLETLIREEREVSVSKEVKSDLERLLFKYATSFPNNPSIDDFLQKFGSEIPRSKLLERWSGKGIYGNAFRNDPSNNQNLGNRLKYFNFVKISQALDGDFAQGGLAAVMAAFNFDILFNRGNKRFVFIADEVPVFIEKCFNFFALSIANIRKNGDAFITIAQRTEHVVVNGNTSILDNSPSKFLFSVDGNREQFSKRLGLEMEEVAKIENLKRVQGKLSQVYHMDSQGKRIFQIILSPEEYWSYTSKREDKDKLESLLKNIPNLTLREAIACLT